MLNGVPRILLIRLSAIGDVVRVLPSLHAIRDQYPHAQIDWAVERRSAEVVLDHPALDQVLIFERPEGFREGARAFAAFCREIRANRYDIVLDFHGILKSGLAAWASRAPERYGFSRPRAQELSFLFTNRKTRLGKEVLNRIEENLRLSEQLAPRRKTLEVSMFVPDIVQQEIEDYFERTFDGGKMVVAMHVPVDRDEKRWPIERFAELADMLLGDGRFEVMLTWGPGQRRDVDQVLARTRRTPQVAPETESLKEYIWLSYCCDLFVGCDTGPMHIASAMGTPVVVLFGGTDARQHAPMRMPCEVLEGLQFAESAATYKGLSGAERLKLIPVEEVYDACVRVSACRRFEPDFDSDDEPFDEDYEDVE